MDKYKWNTGDTLRSIRDIFNLGRTALTKLIIGGIDKADTKLANALNPENEE